MAPGNMQCSFWWRLIVVLFWLNSVYSQAPYSVRLVNGPSPSEGRVEILYNGEWNTICDDYWGLEEAQVVCRQLGYGTDNVTPRRLAYYGQGSGSIRQVQCSGWEYTLASCTLSSGDYICSHSEDAGVNCGTDISTILPSTTTGYYGGIYNVRLVNGPSPSEGRVEILYNGQWNTICDDYWNLEGAQVVCRQLGYSDDNVVARSSAYYGQGSGPIQQVTCDGWEYTLDHCFLSSGDYVCGHYEDAGVRCGDPTTSGTSGASPRVIGSMSFVGVSLFLLTIIAIVGVVFVCNQQKTSPSAAMGMQQLTTLTTNPAPQPASTTPMPAPVCVDVPV